MAVYGADLAYVARNAAAYISAFERCVTEELLPVFANLEERSEAVANAEYARIEEEPADLDYFGLSDAAEWATWKGQAFFNTMAALGQTSVNLFSAGLFHLLEQQLGSLCRTAAVNVAIPKDMKLGLLASWYERHLELNLRSLNEWPVIDELRLVANTVKHGEGESATQLRERRPHLFQHPVARSLNVPVSIDRKIRHPLSGEDFYVTPEIFHEYSQATLRFVGDIERHFESHRNEYYPRCG